jgi:hypothetical protein
MLTKPKSKHLTVRIPEELREALDAAARADRRPVGNLVRLVLADGLMDWLAKRERAAKAARRELERSAAA